MTTLQAYLPQDRLHALARGEVLPDRTTGSALFADISGFTPLTEHLTELHGPRRGVEELTRQLNTVYSALIAQVEAHGGSVIGFAGDAMLCWFGADAEGGKTTEESAASALSSALGMQTAIQAFPALALKVAVASGPARRFMVGDPAVQLIDVLAGETIARTSTGEHLAQQGEVLVDESTVQLLGDSLEILQWRQQGVRFGVIDTSSVVRERPSVNRDADPRSQITDHAALRPYVHQTVYDREALGRGSFLTEFRPCVAMFLRFIGLDYDSDSAQAGLDTFIREVQRIVAHYQGTLMDITIGDKGSYLYINFGAFSTHEDNARRAARAALEIRQATTLQTQMGITQGTLRVGAYGGETRKTWGALGDDVNLAARLMTTAKAGEILTSGRVYKSVRNDFNFEPYPVLIVKGKAEPLSVQALIGERKQRAFRLQEPKYTLQMSGRRQELTLINEKLDLALSGQAQVVGIVAEAGMGKSRLVAEAIRSAHRKEFTGYGGACQSDGIHTPYLTWKSIWQAFFDIDPVARMRKQIRSLEGEIEDLAPSRLKAIPLLNVVLDLDMPGNEFTKALEPQFRKSALTSLFEDCLRAASAEEPLLIVIEDLHWIDTLSLGLLEDMAGALGDSRVCFVLAYRPPHEERTGLIAPRLEALPNFTQIQLKELSRSETEQAVFAKLTQLYPGRTSNVPGPLLDKLIARAQGNPFYLEELCNYLHDSGLDPHDPATLEQLEIPDSLHTLILSRLDQLSDREKTTLQAASVIGRLFRAAWLTGYYPALGESPVVKNDLDQLATLDITPQDSPEPDLAYLFKHIVTHEVTYESLPFATRARLHERLASYMESRIAAGDLTESSVLDLLVHHYTRSDNEGKLCDYLVKASETALGVSAFSTAADYLKQLLALTPESSPAYSARALQLAEARYRMGDYEYANTVIQKALAAAQTDADRALTLALSGQFRAEMGHYTEARDILTRAMPVARASKSAHTLCRALIAMGDVHWRLGNLEDACDVLEESLQLAYGLDEPHATCELFALNRLGGIHIQIDWDEADKYYLRVLELAISVGNREREGAACIGLGEVAKQRKKYALALEYHERAMGIAREIGTQVIIALCLNNIAEQKIHLGDLAGAQVDLRDGLSMALRIKSLPNVVATVAYFGQLARFQGNLDRALALWGLARRYPAWCSYHQQELDLVLADLEPDAEVLEEGMKKGEALDWEETIAALLEP